ncbi:hypothetical protein EX30DRAFT_375646 [Ascodesmis nigricans]|uniref:Uncharacterized protein n=1 Tax=Ascodesmis nigricans TaxID=341454 RepID=A0A4S2MHR8_9PEZI|nr:hypothetical protein EX30DRAFT_375646 [Ascodesmis nigricans]
MTINVKLEPPSTSGTTGYASSTLTPATKRRKLLPAPAKATASPLHRTRACQLIPRSVLISTSAAAAARKCQRKLPARFKPIPAVPPLPPLASNHCNALSKPVPKWAWLKKILNPLPVVSKAVSNPFTDAPTNERSTDLKKPPSPISNASFDTLLLSFHHSNPDLSYPSSQHHAILNTPTQTLIPTQHSELSNVQSPMYGTYGPHDFSAAAQNTESQRANDDKLTDYRNKRSKRHVPSRTS